MFVEEIEADDHEIRMSGLRVALARGASSEVALWRAEIVPILLIDGAPGMTRTCNRAVMSRQL
jgi:hypothetical protein